MWYVMPYKHIWVCAKIAMWRPVPTHMATPVKLFPLCPGDFSTFSPTLKVNLFTQLLCLISNISNMFNIQHIQYV